MSKMSAVHQELHELGLKKVKELEDDVYEMQGIVTENWIIEDYLVRQHNIDRNTATMLVAGAKNRKCSTMLQNEYNEEDGV